MSVRVRVLDVCEQAPCLFAAMHSCVANSLAYRTVFHWVRPRLIAGCILKVACWPPPCRREAKAEAAQEPLLSSFYHASILSHASFARSLAFVLANRLADATLLATELFEIFHQVLRENEGLKQAALLDIVAFYERVRITFTKHDTQGPSPSMMGGCVLLASLQQSPACRRWLLLAA